MINGNLINEIWESAEAKKPLPEKFTDVLEIDYHDLHEIFYENKDVKFRQIVDRLIGGSFLLVRNAFSSQEVNYIKKAMRKLQEESESRFFKMDGLIPDFWRDITAEHSHKYGVPVIKKSAYFFPWNSQKELFELIYERWRIFKVLGGKDALFAEKKTPVDGLVDRIQVVQYPSGSGYLAGHQDPFHNQRLFISGYMSKPGEDFSGGGFWAMNSKDEKVLLEDFVNVGDMGAGYARIIHGVNTIEGDVGSMRWFLGLYTNDSDLVKNRRTLEAPKGL